MHQAAIYSLVGVVIGGCLTGGIQWLGSLRAQRQGVLVAARLIADELMMCAVFLKKALDEKEPLHLRDGVRLAAVWAQYSPALALEMKVPEWEFLGLAVQGVEICADRRNEPWGTRGLEAAISDSHASIINDAMRLLDNFEHRGPRKYWKRLRFIRSAKKRMKADLNKNKNQLAGYKHKDRHKHER